MPSGLWHYLQVTYGAEPGEYAEKFSQPVLKPKALQLLQLLLEYINAIQQQSKSI